MGIRSAVKDFRNGLTFLFGKSEAGEGDRKLAKIAAVVEAQVNSHTKHEIRRRVIADIEKTLRSEAKKGGDEAVDGRIATSLATPEYMRLLRRLGVSEAHLRIVATESKKWAKEKHNAK